MRNSPPRLSGGIGVDAWRSGQRIGAVIGYQLGDSDFAFDDYLRVVSSLLLEAVPGDQAAWNGAEVSTGLVGVHATPHPPWAAGVLAQQLADVMDDHLNAPLHLSLKVPGGQGSAQICAAGAAVTVVDA
jgi:hypothetical protein